jgi:hypothetical protein
MSLSLSKSVLRPACVFAALSAPAFAEDQNAGLSFSLSTGGTSFGAAVQPELRINESFGLRMPIGLGSTSNSPSGETPLSFGDSTKGGVGLLADYYPFGDGLRVGGGVVAGGDRYSFPADTLTVDPFDENEQAFEVVVPDTTEASTGFVRPVVTMGYSGAISRLSVDLDVGVMVDLTRIGGAQDPETSALSATDSAEGPTFGEGMEALGVSPFVKFGAKLSF